MDKSKSERFTYLSNTLRRQFLLYLDEMGTIKGRYFYSYKINTIVRMDNFIPNLYGTTDWVLVGEVINGEVLHNSYAAAYNIICSDNSQEKHTL